jgi:replicative DNA helicase
LTKDGELNNAGGSYYLVELTTRVASTANLEYHARILQQKSMQRNIIAFGTNIVRDAYEDTIDVIELCSQVQREAFELTSFAGGAVKSNESLAMSILKDIHTAMDTEGGGLIGTPSGFRDVDVLHRGFREGNMYVLAGRPGMGKTAYVLNMARNIAIEHNKAVAFFSLEMSSKQLMQRLISSDSGISVADMEGGKLTELDLRKLQQSAERMMSAKITIDDTPGINVFELRSKARRLKLENNIEMIIIDYMQLMTAGGVKGDRMSREQEVSYISRSLKGLGKELGVPVIALSQLSRAVESRGGDKRPQLSDLRESGAIEQDADCVTFIYRPAYYNIFEDEEGNSLKDITELIVAKNRHGATETIKLKFDGATTSFMDYSHYESDFDRMDNEDLPTKSPESVTITTPNQNSGDVPF